MATPTCTWIAHPAHCPHGLPLQVLRTRHVAAAVHVCAHDSLLLMGNQTPMHQRLLRGVPHGAALGIDNAHPSPSTPHPPQHHFWVPRPLTLARTVHSSASTLTPNTRQPSVFLETVVRRNELERAREIMHSLGLFDDRLKGLIGVTQVARPCAPKACAPVCM